MKRTKRARRKRVPTILRTPIEYSHSLDEPNVVAQTASKLNAVFDFYRIKRGDWKQLAIRMAKEKFKTAFKPVPEGTPRKKAEWDCFRKAGLVDFITEQQERGLSQEAAAQLYIDRGYCRRRDIKGLVAQFHRAERWSRLGKLTPQESREIDRLLRRARQRHWKRMGLRAPEMPSKNALRRKSYQVEYEGRPCLVQWYSNDAPTPDDMRAIFGHTTPRNLKH